ncbi:ATP-binding cassette domain-containing protein [Pseudoalteromonas sp. T1lg23B]|uniref:ATP-binding cassette domain-containing protein n=1 Tax=Pseudoalteromonas sp. T1lg23B TaxID=2077097 RepID=UPI000CF68416|nr:ATP-binding cassette domain-containing protein [Pseudoalteromonas sp. T1lg23B]
MEHLLTEDLLCNQLQHSTKQLYRTGMVAQISLAISKPVSQQFACTLRVGEVGVLLAPSGAGKTSLFNAIAGINQASGFLKIGEHDTEQIELATYKRNIAYVTQTPVLFGHLSVGALLDVVSAQQARPFDIKWALEPLKLDTILHMRTLSLSGGQRQRLALLLAMIKGATLLLLDEVLTGQDPSTKLACITVIKTYLKRNQAAALIACHQLEDALALADIAFLQQQRAGIKQWQVMPISNGIHAYQQSLLNDCADTAQDQQTVCASAFLSVLHATTISHDPQLGLCEYRVAGQPCFSAYSPHISAKQSVLLVLRANRVAISKSLLPESSFVNQWQAKIVSIRPVSCQGEHGMLIDVTLVNQGALTTSQQDVVSVWITRLSYNQLHPKIGESWYLISKADAVSLSCLN